MPPPGGLASLPSWVGPRPTPRAASPRTASSPAFSQVTLPVYLNFTRADLIFTVDFEIATKEDPRSFYERGVAVLCTE